MQECATEIHDVPVSGKGFDIIPYVSRDSDVLAVIVHFGDLDQTVRSAESVQSWAGLVCVISNDLQPRPSGLSERIQWLIPERNLGYAGAAMYAWNLHSSSHRYMALLNNDLEIDAKSARACLAVLGTQSIAVSAPVLRESGVKQNVAAGFFSRRLRIPYRVVVGQEDTLWDCAWVSGAAMFINGPTLSASSFDTSYFLGFEDCDFCLRLKNRNERVVIVTDSRAKHVGGASIGRNWYYYANRNLIWFVRKHFGEALALIVWSTRLALIPRVLAADVLQRRGLSRTALMLHGLRDAWRKPLHSSNGEPVR